MKRRQFMVGMAGICLPSLLSAQQSKVWRVAYLIPGFMKEGDQGAVWFGLLRSELNNLGYVEGRNLVLDRRAAETHNDRLAELAKELVALRPDAIVAVSTPAIAAARQATSTIPIIMTSASDPIGSGFIKSLSHPGGNLTGLADMYADHVFRHGIRTPFWG